MSLVTSGTSQVNLNVRVYKRSKTHLVLLWSKLPELVDPKQVHISAKSLEPVVNPSNNIVQVREFLINPATEEPGETPTRTDPDTIVCVINETKNNLNPDHNYYITINYPQYNIRQGLRVVRAGVFPEHEKESKEKNVHEFLWDEKSQQWRKKEGIMVDGKFYEAVVVVPCPDCGWKGNNNK